MHKPFLALIFSLIFAGALFAPFRLVLGQSVCPTGYYQKDDICCSSAAEAPPTGSYAYKPFCFKRKAMSPEKVCQKVPGTTPGIWCPQSQACGYGKYSVTMLGPTYEFDLCITPPPPGPTVNIGSVQNSQTNAWTAIFCSASTEEAGPAGVPYNAFYCQPKKVNNVIVAPPDRQSCTSGAGEYAGENWCCPEGQEARVQARGTPYCAILPVKLNVLSPAANQRVSGVVPIKVKLVAEGGRYGVGKFKQLTVAIKAASTGVFLKPPTPLTFEAGVPDNAGRQGSARTYTINWNTQGLRAGDYLIYVSAIDDFGDTTNAEPYSTIVKITENSVKSLSIVCPKDSDRVSGPVTVVAALDGEFTQTLDLLLDKTTFLGRFSSSQGSQVAPSCVVLPKNAATDNLSSRPRYFYGPAWDTTKVVNGWHNLSLFAVNNDNQSVSDPGININVQNQTSTTQPVSSNDDGFGPAVQVWAEPASWTAGSEQWISFKTTAQDPNDIASLSIQVGNLPSQTCPGFSQPCVLRTQARSVSLGTAVKAVAVDNSSARRQTVVTIFTKSGGLDNKEVNNRVSTCSPVANSATASARNIPSNLSGISPEILAQIFAPENKGNCAPLAGNNAPGIVANGAPTEPATPTPGLDLGVILQVILKLLGRGII